jgi:N-glycosyltransferase
VPAPPSSTGGPRPADTAFGEPTADGIVTAVRETLADPGIASRARAARLAMLALPEIDSAVTELEKLV